MSDFTSRREPCEICERGDNRCSRFQRRRVPLSTNHTVTIVVACFISRFNIHCASCYLQQGLFQINKQVFEVNKVFRSCD